MPAGLGWPELTPGKGPAWLGFAGTTKGRPAERCQLAAGKLPGMQIISPTSSKWDEGDGKEPLRIRHCEQNSHERVAKHEDSCKTAGHSDYRGRFYGQLF